MKHGQALRMRVELARLANRHRALSPEKTGIVQAGSSFLSSHHSVSDIVFPSPCHVPAILDGYASTPDIDLERVKFRPYCLGWRPWRLPPLYYRHDTSRVVGEISELYYDNGQLRVRATVTDDNAARCGAFSIAATITDYELRDEDSPNFYAVVRSAWLDEISLTDVPCNPQALVIRRYSVPPSILFYTLMTARVQRLQQLTALIQQELRT